MCANKTIFRVFLTQPPEGGKGDYCLKKYIYYYNIYIHFLNDDNKVAFIFDTDNQLDNVIEISYRIVLSFEQYFL